MKKSVLLLLALIFSLNSLSADITQLNEEEYPHYKISVTHGGNDIGFIEISLFPDVAPKHCHNFDSLVSINFYDGTAFHRVIPNFMIQGGGINSKDPNKSKEWWGMSDPSQTKVPAEFNEKKHLRGIMSAARGSDPNSATSQFFICVTTCDWLDNKYSIYGEVINGMDVVDYIVSVPRDGNDCPNDKVEMTVTKMGEDEVEETVYNNPQNITVSPNPTSGAVSFKSDAEDIMVSSVQVCDINGSTVIKENFAEMKSLNEMALNLESLSSGIYLINIIDDKAVSHNFRIVVNK